jgi:abscisic acid receptor (PYR/PYL family)
VRSFDQPQRYKPFVRNCVVRGDQLEVGSLRDVNVKTGLPATTSTERLEQLDDDLHILGVKFVGGDHRLQVSAAAPFVASLHMLCFMSPPWLSVYSHFFSMLALLPFFLL